jgi:hypothetical protein
MPFHLSARIAIAVRAVVGSACGNPGKLLPGMKLAGCSNCVLLRHERRGGKFTLR